MVETERIPGMNMTILEFSQWTADKICNMTMEQYLGIIIICFGVATLSWLIDKLT